MLLVSLNNYYCLLKTVFCSQPMTRVEVERNCKVFLWRILNSFIVNCSSSPTEVYQAALSFIKTASFNCWAPCRWCVATLTSLNSTSPALTHTQTSQKQNVVEGNHHAEKKTPRSEHEKNDH